MKKVEIACCNLDSVIHANEAGADRIELFENLLEGGCTPSYGMIKKAKEISKIPIYVMIRPRSGGFHYSEAELDVMMHDIDICHKLQVDGIVLGALNETNEVDEKNCHRLLNHWENKPATFHRAVDITPELNTSFEAIIHLGFERILTSGGKVTAVEGLETIIQLNTRFSTQINIQAGSGINEENVYQFQFLNEIHATCKKQTSNHQTLFENYFYSDDEKIKRLIKGFKEIDI